VNENYEDIDFGEDVDIVGITCYTMTAPRVYEIADEFRKRGKTVILGGYHPTAMPEEAKQHADSVIKGMAELTWPRALEDFEKGLNALQMFIPEERARAKQNIQAVLSGEELGGGQTG
jgi:radical SAM superfamily enzyme YgiQ (UPF0313 family)